MILAPKLASCDYRYDAAPIKNVGSKMEIQLEAKRWGELSADCLQLIDRVRDCNFLDEVVLHMPFGKHTMLSYVDPLARVDFFDFIYTMAKIADDRDMKLGFLFHADETVFTCSADISIKILHEMAGYMVEVSPNIYILIENTGNYVKDTWAEFLQRCPAGNVFGCLDVCHVRNYESATHQPYQIPVEAASRIRWVHFAAAQPSHAHCHEDADSVLVDLYYLHQNGVDLASTPLVAEIAEDDYIKRPCMIKELRLLEEAFNYVD